jgi:hypothetical protein
MSLMGLGQDLTATGTADTFADTSTGATVSGVSTGATGAGACGANPCGFTDLFMPSATCSAYLACGAASTGSNIFCGVSAGLGVNCTILTIGLIAGAFFLLKGALGK